MIQCKPLFFAALVCTGGCQTVPARVTGPTLPLPQLTPEALGMSTVPPGAITFANRAWNSKPGLLLALIAFNKAVSSNLHIEKMLATKLVVVTSALNQCLY